MFSRFLIVLAFCGTASWSLGLSPESRYFITSVMLLAGVVIARQLKSSVSELILLGIGSVIPYGTYLFFRANGREGHEAVYWGIQAILYALVLRRGNASSILPFLIPGLCLSIAFDTLFDLSPHLLHRFNEVIKFAFGTLTQLLSGHQLLLGSAYLDFGSLIFCFTSLGILAGQRRERSVRKLLSNIAITIGLLLCWASFPFVAVIAEDLYEPFLNTRFSAVFFEVTRVTFVNVFAFISHGHSGWFYAIFVALILTFVSRSHCEVASNAASPPLDVGASPYRKWCWGQATVGFLGLGLLVSLTIYAFQPTEVLHLPKKVAIHDPGNVWTKKLDSDSEQPATNGFFSSLPTLLEVAGVTATGCNLRTETLPEGTDVLILMNLEANFPDEKTEAIRAFVAEGGSVLCLGDHTGMETIRAPFNRLLEGTGIEFNFDSACPFRSWEGRIRLDSSIAGLGFGKLFSRSSICYGTGASLSVKGSARTMALACGGYIDPGDATRSGNLGNLTHDFGEDCIDIPIIAEAKLGKGTFVVFGDTSPFQSGSLPRSYSFVLSVLSYLGPHHPDRLTNVSFVYVALIVLVLLLAILFIDAHSVLQLSGASLVLLFALLSAFPQLTLGTIAKHLDLQRVALIDRSNLPKYTAYAGVPLGMDSVIGSFERTNLLPVFLEKADFASVSKARCLISIEPLHAVNLIDVHRYMREGGIYVLSADGTNAILKSLGSELGLAMAELPLGEFETNVTMAEKDYSLHFVSGWELPSDDRYDLIVNAWKRVVAFRLQVGKGYLICIADGRFFLEKNMEHKGKSNYPQNVEFTKTIIRSTLELSN
jgi:hypothetical protein